MQTRSVSTPSDPSDVQLCPSLAWVRVTAPTADMAAATPTPTPANRSIFVHYHFHETASRPCEASRKRTSLELFLQRAVLPSPPSVLFLFTLSGHALPPPAAYFESIALPRNKRAEIFPSRANVLVQTVPPSTTDLCHRALAIRTARSRSLRRGAPTPEFGLFLNDGARGPFLHPDSPTLGAALGVPPWLARYVGAFSEGGGAGGSGSGGSARIGAVGACFSCQIDSHLQSWAMMVDWRLSALLLERYSKTCARRVGPGRLPDAAKREAVVEGEVHTLAIPPHQSLAPSHSSATPPSVGHATPFLLHLAGASDCAHPLIGLCDHFLLSAPADGHQRAEAGDAGGDAKLGLHQRL